MGQQQGEEECVHVFCRGSFPVAKRGICEAQFLRERVGTGLELAQSKSVPASFQPSYLEGTPYLLGVAAYMEAGCMPL